jgi:hypothetical protein
MGLEPFSTLLELSLPGENHWPWHVATKTLSCSVALGIRLHVVTINVIILCAKDQDSSM